MPGTRLAATVRLTAVLAAAAALSACDVVVNSIDVKGQAQDQWTKNYPIAANGELEITNPVGRIDVAGGEGTQVEIVAERMVKAVSDEEAKKLLSQLQVVEDVAADSVRLETKAPTGENRRVEVKYHVKVPASVSVRLKCANGAVDVVGVKGSVKVDSDNGAVSGRQLGGAVEATTTNGVVRLEVLGVAKGGIRAETVNGSVELTLPATAKADVQATCMNGRVATEGLKIEGPETTRRRVEGRLNGGGPKIVLETTNGRILLTGK